MWCIRSYSEAADLFPLIVSSECFSMITNVTKVAMVDNADSSIRIHRDDEYMKIKSFFLRFGKACEQGGEAESTAPQCPFPLHTGQALFLCCKDCPWFLHCLSVPRLMGGLGSLLGVVTTFKPLCSHNSSSSSCLD